MPTILCFGDSNTWGAVPGSDTGRFGRDVRWPGAMAAILGGDFEVRENGRNGRTRSTTDCRDPGEKGCRCRS